MTDFIDRIAYLASAKNQKPQIRANLGKPVFGESMIGYPKNNHKHHVEFHSAGRRDLGCWAKAHTPPICRRRKTNTVSIVYWI